MGKIDVSKFKKTSNGFVPVDGNGNEIGIRTLLQSGSLDYNSKNSKMTLLNTSSGKYSYFSGSKLNSVESKKLKNKDKNIKKSNIKKKSVAGKIKLTNAPYLLLRVHKYKTDKGVIRDYKYVLQEKATGNEIVLEKKDIEKFFENKSWDGIDKSKRLLSGSGALVDGLIENYYAKDDTWHLRVNKYADVVIDDSKDGNKVKDSYTMTEVYATTSITNKGIHKLEKYAFVLENNRTKESEIYTRDQLFNLLINNDKSGIDLYDNSRLQNASIQYHQNSKGSESYRVRVVEDKVIWHIDENLNKDTKVGKYVCTKVFRVQVPCRNGKVQNQYVEFEMLTLSNDDVKAFNNGEFTVDELNRGETFIVTGADLVAMVELPEATEFPFYDSSKLDNLKLKNKKGSTIYDKVAEIEVYKTGKLPDSSIFKIEPTIVDLDYEVWKKSHAEHVEKIEKFIKNKEDKAINTVITWDEVLAQPLTDEEMNAVNITFADFWKNRFNGMCRISTLPLELEMGDTPISFDIIPMDKECKNPNMFVVKESRTEGSIKSSSIRKFALEGEVPQDIDEVLGHYWVKFLSCVANKLDRRLVLILGKKGRTKYAITCVDEVTQRKVIGNKEVYYIPFIWSELFNVKVQAKSLELAEKLVYNKLNIESNIPKKELREFVKSSLKVDEALLEEMKKNNITKVRPVMESKGEVESEFIGTDCDIFNTDDGVELIQRDENNLNTYLVKVEVEMKGYMAIDSTSEEEAYKVRLAGILDGSIEFNGTSKYIENSIKILNCELIQDEEIKEEKEDLEILEDSNEIWNSLNGIETKTLENINLNNNTISKTNLSNKVLYRCRAEYQHDNQPFAEGEIKIQINYALRDVFYELKDFECVDSEKVDSDDYLFIFEFTIEASRGLDMQDFMNDVDSGQFLGIVDENGEYLETESEQEEEDKGLEEEKEEFEEIDINKNVTFKRNSVKFNFFDKARKLSGVSYNVVELYDLVKEDDTDSYDFIYSYFKNYKASQVNQIFKLINENNRYLDNNYLSINSSEDEIQLNKSITDNESKILFILKLVKNKKISDFRVEISNSLNYSCNTLSKYLHEFCDEVTNYIDNLIKIMEEESEKEVNMSLENKNIITDKLSPNMFMDVPVKFIVAEDEGFDVELNQSIEVPSVKAFANLVCKRTEIQQYDNLYGRRENFNEEQIKLVNKYSEAVLYLIKEPLSGYLGENGLIINYQTRLSVNKDLQNIDVKFVVLFNQSTNQLDLEISTENMQILRYFGAKWADFDNMFKDNMVIIFEKLNKIIEVESEINNLKESNINCDWSFLDNFVQDTIQNMNHEEDIEIEESLLNAWKDLSSQLDLNKNNDLNFENEDEIELESNEELDTGMDMDFNFDMNSQNEMSDDDLLDLFNNLGTVDVNTSNTSNISIPSIFENELDDTFDTGLDDLEDLEESEQVKQVEVDQMMFLTVFDNLLKIIDDKYEEGSIAVIEDEFIITENGIDLKSTKETVNRMKSLLTVEKPIKLSNIYIKLLDSIVNKGILETIATESQIFAILSNMYEKYGNDMIDKTYRDDGTILGIASSEILAETLQKSGIDSNKFGFLNGVIKK